jgi:hypothetical protein
MTPEELAASKAAANLKRRLRMLWSGDSTIEEIADELVMSEEQVSALAASMGLGERPEVDLYEPDEKTIRAACARIRAGWTPDERESRLAGPPRGRLE